MKAVFLDKDGTLVENDPYNVDPGRMRLAPGAAEGVRALAQCGYRLFVISNQPGVALKKFGEAQLGPVFHRLHHLLPDLQAFYYCPHSPEQRCACRKPACGLLERAASEHGIDLENSWMVGDILDDVEAGRRAGCKTVLVDNGNETEWQLSEERKPHAVARDLSAAAQVILSGDWS